MEGLQPTPPVLVVLLGSRVAINCLRNPGMKMRKIVANTWVVAPVRSSTVLTFFCALLVVQLKLSLRIQQVVRYLASQHTLKNKCAHGSDQQEYGADG